MLMTEEEAKELACHKTMGRKWDEVRKCIGSDCMAWRVVRSGTINNPTRTPGQGFGTRPAGGYCGLAGKPE